MFRRFISMFEMSLIELMIMLAIVGILAAIAVPGYQDYKCRNGEVESCTARYYQREAQKAAGIALAQSKQYGAGLSCIDGVLYFQKTMTPKYKSNGSIESCTMGN